MAELADQADELTTVEVSFASTAPISGAVDLSAFEDDTGLIEPPPRMIAPAVLGTGRHRRTSRGRAVRQRGSRRGASRGDPDDGDGDPDPPGVDDPPAGRDAAERSAS